VKGNRIGCLMAIAAGALFPRGAQATPSLAVSLRTGSSHQIIQSFSKDTLATVRSNSIRETVPGDGQPGQWQGPSLSALIDVAINALPPEKKAQIDVLILRGKGGRTAVLPRALAQKYPIVVATQKDGKPLSAEAGPIMLVIPWTTRPALKAEGAPLEKLFVTGLEKIELANYREVYGHLFLRRRTDPSAMRGEKLFVQNCLTCHAAGHGPAVDEIAQQSRARKLSENGHPHVSGAPELTSRDRRALRSYLDAFMGEQGSDALGQSQASAR
jgi:hypothetical protein